MMRSREDWYGLGHLESQAWPGPPWSCPSRGSVRGATRARSVPAAAGVDCPSFGTEGALTVSLN